MNPGSIVRFRNRDWVLLPRGDDGAYALRPLTGATDDVVVVHRMLSALLQYSLPEERLRPSAFPPPSPDDLSDAVGAHLLWQAARLTLRDGAAPLRSLGRISVRPRIYQFTPLLMSLRLDPVRLFIADDVGVGKTIEALLVAREFIDRGEVRRLAVLCPPYLCDQWEKELKEKFDLEAVVIRSSTISSLERGKPPNKSIYEHYPFHVISIDWVKSDRNRHQFLEFCPELVIVDEAHGAAEASERNKSQQQRHQLLREIAADEDRHLILLTATPHSGVETAFRSILGLLRPEFRDWDVGALRERERIELAKHFVQRTRRDIERDWEGEHCFPERVSQDATYALSEEYRRLFDQTYKFCSELVRTGEGLEERRRRVRYWGALALLRCVMSSPAAAVAALERRAGEHLLTEESDFGPFVFEATDEMTDDETPTPPIEAAEEALADSERRKLRALARIARKLHDSSNDAKLDECAKVVRELLSDGFNPIVWCRYVATAEYVADGLRRSLDDGVQVTAITGRIGDEERRIKIEELDADRPRCLVATDCLSEGVNLQEKFTAALHYDLPWNPNRLEQREGRVDRYGQTAKEVRAVRFYGRDNPVDGAVIEVLLNKARDIRKALGTSVPVPEESETVMQAVLNALFLRRREQPRQLTLFEQNEELQVFHQRWDIDAERERVNRTRFAQRALRPEEVKRELEAVDAVLGDPDAVREFCLSATQRLGIQMQPDRRQSDVFRIAISPEAVAGLPDAVRFELPEAQKGTWRVSFVSPTPEGAEYVGRRHRFVAALARYLLEDALAKGKDAAIPRCGLIRASTIDRLTTLLLLRVRYLIEMPNAAPLLSEEVFVTGYRRAPGGRMQWLEGDDALRLLAASQPEGNVPPSEKRELVERSLDQLGGWDSGGEWGVGNPLQEEARERIVRRARDLEASHKRIRKAVSLRIRELKVKPQFPPDLLGILVLQPMVKL